MLFKDLVSLPYVALLALLTVLILKEAVVELWRGIKHYRFVEIAHHLSINLYGIFRINL